MILYILSGNRYFFILILAILLISIGASNVTRIDVDAKKIKTSTSSDKASSHGSKHKTTDSISQAPQPTTRLESTSNNKLVIINFDDSHESDYTYAKPILDKYGFKATFFEVCNWVETGYHDQDISTTWQQISALQQDGMDIEAHTMNHPNLDDLCGKVGGRDKVHNIITMAIMCSMYCGWLSQAKTNKKAYAQEWVDSFKKLIIDAFEIGQAYSVDKP